MDGIVQIYEICFDFFVPEGEFSKFYFVFAFLLCSLQWHFGEFVWTRNVVLFSVLPVAGCSCNCGRAVFVSNFNAYTSCFNFVCSVLYGKVGLYTRKWSYKVEDMLVYSPVHFSAWKHICSVQSLMKRMSHCKKESYRVWL